LKKKNSFLNNLTNKKGSLIMINIHLDPTKKHDAILLFDCQDGNPNGDPDAGNQPRIDPQTNHGFVTDACLKRKVRNFIQMVADGEDNPKHYRIFIKEGSILNNTLEAAYDESGTKKVKKDKTNTDAVGMWMRQNYYDIRMFGGVLSTGDYQAGQVWGATQVSFARSIDPVLPQSISITRCATTDGKEGKDNKTMGRKEIIAYGLYRSHVFYNPHLAHHVTERDLQLLWDSLVKCWEFDRSASRGFMTCRGLYILSHTNKYGSAPVHQLFDKLQVRSLSKAPRSFADYEVEFSDNLPDGVTLTKLA
jgi:CRISPR-associated protein Csd2